ncbi:MAG TPA: glucose-6-phosphate isomerase, partial [Novosphingobium sp.]
MSDGVQQQWAALAALPQRRLADLFAQPGRLDRLATTLDLPGGSIRFDWSKTHLDTELIAGFERLAAACDFVGRRAALLSGEAVNATEGRAAEHPAQRGMGKPASVEEAAALQARMHMLVEAIHGGALGEVRHLIHIGIGGSALGPALAIDALTRDGAEVAVHVVSNIDGCALEQAFAACDPATTLIAV